MKRSLAFNYPGNSTREQSFYAVQDQPVLPGAEWPGPTAGDDEGGPVAPARPDPSPFKITRG